MSAVYICECTHPKSRHKRERDGCRALDCGCAKFEADMDASAKAQGADRTRVLTAVAEVCEDRAAKTRAELAGEPNTMSTSARLAKTEQENERLRLEVGGLRARLIDVGRERDEAEQHGIQLMRERDEARAEARDQQRRRLEVAAELASARQELEQLRGALTNTTTAYLATTTKAASAELYAYDALYCTTCYGRFLPGTDAADNHPHPLIPVLVSITHRTEGPTE